jgi:hypothetical protein
MKCTEPVPRPGQSSSDPPPAGPCRGVGSTQEFPTFDGPYTTLELIMKTIGGDAPPKIN